jgi:hypothetical protein
MPRVIKRSASPAVKTDSSRRGVSHPALIPPQLSQPGGTFRGDILRASWIQAAPFFARIVTGAGDGTIWQRPSAVDRMGPSRHAICPAQQTKRR